ncbi:MAG TPA: hypothetical protein VJI15_03950 [Candidatus Nanoarchaeia archaeon]|nr:hypothetical protein [Candidatus Nanoarchaeia archaeon]
MVHQWEKGIYEVVAGTAGVAINNVPVVDSRGIDPFAVFAYLEVMREALAITSRRIIEKTTRYLGPGYRPIAALTQDLYSLGFYKNLLSRGIRVMEDIGEGLENKVMKLSTKVSPLSKE